MFGKNRIIRMVVCVLLGVLCLYTGISCLAVLHRAASQPYLVSGSERFDFMGYDIMAAANGAACIVSAVLLVFLLVSRRRNNKPLKG